MRSDNEPEQVTLTQGLRLPLTTLVFLNAALVTAANLLIMASERSKEIGIMKAVGATRFKIVQMVLCEALLITLFGAISSFTFFRFPAAFNQWTNGVNPNIIISTILRDFLIAIEAAYLSSALFAMLPAFRMGNLSVRETVQGESV